MQHHPVAYMPAAVAAFGVVAAVCIGLYVSEGDPFILLGFLGLGPVHYLLPDKKKPE